MMPPLVAACGRQLPAWLLTAAFVLAGLLLAVVIVQGSFFTSLLVLGALVVLTIGLAHPETALYLLLFAMLLSPEFGQRTAAGSGGSGVTLRLDDFLLVLLGLSWLTRMAIEKELGVFRHTPMNGPIFLYFAVCLAATAVGVLVGSVRPLRGFFYLLKYFEYYFIYFMAANHLRDRGQAARFVVAMLCTCLIIDIFGLLQIPSGERVTAPFEGNSGEPNTLGGYLVLMTALSTGLALYLPRPSLTLPLWLLSGLNLIVLLYTRSRGSYLAFLAMFLTLLAMTRRSKLLLVGAALVILGLFALPEVVRERIAYTFMPQATRHTVVGSVALDPSTSARIEGWQHGLAAFFRRPLLGHGVTGYGFVDSQYLLLLLDCGLLGLLAFFAQIRKLLAVSWHNWRHGGDGLQQGLTAGFIAGTVGLLVHGVSANTFVIVRIMEPFWFLAALAVLLPTLPPRPEEAR
ncbi:MAG: O-antigen ligase family protein [Thermodesulfobacteriota bacterium]